MIPYSDFVFRGGEDVKRYWNVPAYKQGYERIYEDAKGCGYSDDELENSYFVKLTHQTKSHRIMRMIALAYYLGKMKGFSDCDEGHTPISLS